MRRSWTAAQQKVKKKKTRFVNLMTTIDATKKGNGMSSCDGVPKRLYSCRTMLSQQPKKTATSNTHHFKGGSGSSSGGGRPWLNANAVILLCLN